MTHALSLRGLTFAYGTQDALYEIDLDLPEGEILGLIGPNGAGKTTLLRLLTGQMAPRYGEADVLGDRAPRLGAAVRASLGLVFESTRLPSTMRGNDLLRFCARLHPDWDPARAAALCARLDIDTAQRVRQWSRGTRAKFAVVLAVAYRPRLLLLDEPFGGIDAVAREDVLDVVLEEVAASRCSVLIATHDLREVERIADRVAYLHAGRLVFHERTEDLLERHRRVRVVLAHDDDETPAWASEGLDLRRDGRVIEFVTQDVTSIPSPNGSSLAVDRMSLEDIFVAHARASREGAGR